MSSLFSPAWYRIADLRPRLRSQARLSRHVYRGERWHVLQDLGSGRHLRLNPAAYRVVVLMDGLRTVDEIWRQACLTQGDDAPSQDEVVRLLSQLHNANVLISDKRPDLAEMHERGAKARRQKLKQYLANPLSLKLPLLDPDRWLAAMVGMVTPRVWPLLMGLWLVLVCSAVVGAIYYWAPLTEDLAARSFTPENVLLLALVFPVLKIVHEFGHGLAIKAYGGACREMGVMLLVFLPIPYVDAGQATGFPDKRRRMLVGAAGMMAELAVAAVAFWLWTWAEPGLFKSVLHQALILSGVTTLLFNANPLLRFDGYYILGDWLEIPNFGNKANHYLGYLLSRHVFGAEHAESPHLTPREGYWLATYGIASFLYRMTVAVAIILFVADAFFFVGVLLAFWAAWSMLLLPLLRQLRNLSLHPALEGARARAWTISTGFALLALLVVFALPASSWTSAEGVIWMTDDARVRATHPCFGAAVLARPGAAVKRGQPLIDCGDPDLDARVAQARARLDELQTRFNLAAGSEPVQMQIVRAEIGYARAQQEDLLARRRAMVMTSAHDGVFHMDAPGDFPGRYVERGEAVAYVLDPARIALFSVVPQGEVDLVRQQTRKVELRGAGDVWNLVTATVRREVPAATRELPSLALSLAGGGKIGLDPNTSANGEAAALTSLFQFELALPADYPITSLGGRVHVRFIHPDEPLGEQWHRSIRQVFLKRFAV
jgi:putative peptide zinc metalloprotease protein